MPSVSLLSHSLLGTLKHDLELAGGKTVAAGQTVVIVPETVAECVLTPENESSATVWPSISRVGHTHAEIEEAVRMLAGHVNDPDAHGGNSGGASIYVAQPQITSPASGGTVVVVDGTLAVTSGPFSVFGTKDSHVATDWRILTAAKDGVVVKEDVESQDLTAHVFTDLSLTAGNTYFIQCRHKSENLGYSVWSAPVPFTAANGVMHHGFLLYRHVGDEATVIQYKAADGTIQKMAVKDAKFREVLPFGTQGIDLPELNNFQSVSKNGGSYINGGSSPLPTKVPLPTSLSNDLIFEQWGGRLLQTRPPKKIAIYGCVITRKKTVKVLLVCRRWHGVAQRLLAIHRVICPMLIRH